MVGGGCCKAPIGCLLGDGGEAAAAGVSCRLATRPPPAGCRPGAAQGRLGVRALGPDRGLVACRACSMSDPLEDPAIPRG